MIFFSFAASKGIWIAANIGADVQPCFTPSRTAQSIKSPVVSHLKNKIGFYQAHHILQMLNITYLRSNVYVPYSSP